jgi:hypothetical protein
MFESGRKEVKSCAVRLLRWVEAEVVDFGSEMFGRNFSVGAKTSLAWAFEASG